MSNKYIIVDVETANSNVSSICQIGIVVMQHGNIIEEWETLVNPNTYFDDFNSELHGIDEHKVKNAPAIEELIPTIESYFNQGLVCSYGSFDRSAFQKVLPQFDYQWLDITLLVRRTWEKVAYKGYGLSNVAKMLNIPLTHHHDALSDARTASLILSKALELLHFDVTALNKLLSKSLKRLGYSQTNEKNDWQAPNPDGLFFGEVVVFTGTLSIARNTAMQIAYEKGFDIGSSVTKKTTYLVKGVQDLSVLNGKEKSSKEIKALEMMKKGFDIIFLSEDDFFNLIK